MKVASDGILAAAAQALGETETENTLRSYADEEAEFASALASQLGPLTKDFLQRSNRGQRRRGKPATEGGGSASSVLILAATWYAAAVTAAHPAAELFRRI